MIVHSEQLCRILQESVDHVLVPIQYSQYECSGATVITIVHIDARGLLLVLDHQRRGRVGETVTQLVRGEHPLEFGLSLEQLLQDKCDALHAWVAFLNSDAIGFTAYAGERFIYAGERFIYTGAFS